MISPVGNCANYEKTNGIFRVFLFFVSKFIEFHPSAKTRDESFQQRQAREVNSIIYKTVKRMEAIKTIYRKKKEGRGKLGARRERLASVNASREITIKIGGERLFAEKKRWKIRWKSIGQKYSGRRFLSIFIGFERSAGFLFIREKKQRISVRVVSIRGFADKNKTNDAGRKQYTFLSYIDVGSLFSTPSLSLSLRTLPFPIRSLSVTPAQPLAERCLQRLADLLHALLSGT